MFDGFLMGKGINGCLKDPFVFPFQSVFTEDLIVQFLTVLLQVLLHRSHDLLREEITACVYNMAAVDFEAFFAHFVARFLEQTEGVDDGQRQMLKANLKTDTVSELSLLSSMCTGIWHLFRSLG